MQRKRESKTLTNVLSALSNRTYHARCFGHKTGQAIFLKALTHEAENIGKTDWHLLVVELRNKRAHTLRRITIISALQMKQSLIERRTSARRAPLSESSAAPEEESV